MSLEHIEDVPGMDAYAPESSQAHNLSSSDLPPVIKETKELIK